MDTAVGYVLLQDGTVLVQRPEKNAWGFSLHSDDQEWPGGIGCGSEHWELLADNDPRITQAVRGRLAWILDTPDPIQRGNDRASGYRTKDEANWDARQRDYDPDFAYRVEIATQSMIGPES